jgi:putative membrane protein
MAASPLLESGDALAPPGARLWDLRLIGGSRRRGQDGRAFLLDRQAASTDQEHAAVTNDSTSGQVSPSSNKLATERTDLASARTLMAADRSLMAWIRTGLSMISFGFTIYKILDGFKNSAIGEEFAHSPRTVGLLLTGLGTMAVVAGTVEYFHRRRELLVYGPIRLWRPSFTMAVLMSVVGLILFFGITSKLL